MSRVAAGLVAVPGLLIIGALLACTPVHHKSYPHPVTSAPASPHRTVSGWVPPKQPTPTCSGSSHTHKPPVTTMTTTSPAVIPPPVTTPATLRPPVRTSPVHTPPAVTTPASSPAAPRTPHLANTGPSYLRDLIWTGVALVGGGFALVGTVLALGRRRGH